MMKHFALTCCFAAAAIAAPANAALTVETTSFITSPTNFNGFEGLGTITGADGVTSYVEDGISVSYVGTLSGIWSGGFTAPEGQYTWYPDGGGTGYTSITFADTTEAQFLASTGYFNSPPQLAYEVLLDGVSIGSGIAGPLPMYDGMTFVAYGFSGALFDELRLQATTSGFDFNPTGFDALALESITLGAGATVPEPATWAMMIGGMGLAAGSLRARRRKVAFATA